MSNVPDAIAITNLLYRYAELIDAGDYEGIGAHLAHAVITADGAPDETIGADAIAAMYHHTTRKYEDGTPLTKHVITNPIVEVADDGLTGTCRSYYTVLQRAGDAPLRPIISSRRSSRSLASRPRQGSPLSRGSPGSSARLESEGAPMGTRWSRGSAHRRRQAEAGFEAST